MMLFHLFFAWEKCCIVTLRTFRLTKWGDGITQELGRSGVMWCLPHTERLLARFSLRAASLEPLH